MTDVTKTPILKVENLIHGVGRDFPSPLRTWHLCRIFRMDVSGLLLNLARPSAAF